MHQMHFRLKRDDKCRQMNVKVHYMSKEYHIDMMITGNKEHGEMVGRWKMKPEIDSESTESFNNKNWVSTVCQVYHVRCWGRW